MKKRKAQAELNRSGVGGRRNGSLTACADAWSADQDICERCREIGYVHHLQERGSLRSGQARLVKSFVRSSILSDCASCDLLASCVNKVSKVAERQRGETPLKGEAWLRQQDSNAKWRARGQPYYVIACMANVLFGLPPESYADADAVVLAVVPGWHDFDADKTNTSTLDFQHPINQAWLALVREAGFLTLNDHLKPNAPYSGRLVNNGIDYDTVKSWLSYCDQEHDKSCSEPSAHSSHTALRLQVIDCETRKLVELPAAEAYVALSYVWGESPAGADSVDTSALPISCPQVVEDVLAVTRGLGYRYCWIDRYCIDQGNAEQKHKLISNMDLVYTGASLAVIAAAGSDATHGLPGVNGRLREHQPSLAIGSHNVVFCSPDGNHTLAEAVWSSRAWTYQEGLLPRRLLIFTEAQVHFQCMAMHGVDCINIPFARLHGTEKRYHNRFTLGRLFPLGELARRETVPGDFLARVNEYGKRVLSFDSDGLNAFMGILKLFHSTSTRGKSFNSRQFLYTNNGIPFFKASSDKEYVDETTGFAAGLLWATSADAVRRQDLPSWSWTGWKGWTSLTYPFSRVKSTSQIGEGSRVTVLMRQANVEIKIVHADARQVVIVGRYNETFKLYDWKSKMLMITAYITTLHLRRINRQWRAFASRDAAAVALETKHLHVQAQDEGNVRAILMSFHEEHQRQTTTFMLLLVRRIEARWERIGVCSLPAAYNFWKTHAMLGRRPVYLSEAQVALVKAHKPSERILTTADDARFVWEERMVSKLQLAGLTFTREQTTVE